jgi:hypothetical protein
MMLQVACKHIYGYAEGFAVGSDDPDEEYPSFLMEPHTGGVDMLFSFCPKCGERLIKNEARSDA